MACQIELHTLLYDFALSGPTVAQATSSLAQSRSISLTAPGECLSHSAQLRALGAIGYVLAIASATHARAQAGDRRAELRLASPQLTALLSGLLQHLVLEYVSDTDLRSLSAYLALGIGWRPDSAHTPAGLNNPEHNSASSGSADSSEVLNSTDLKTAGFLLTPSHPGAPSYPQPETQDEGPEEEEEEERQSLALSFGVTILTTLTKLALLAHGDPHSEKWQVSLSLSLSLSRFYS